MTAVNYIEISATENNQLPRLTATECHVWCVNIQEVLQSYERCWVWLDEEERARALQFHFERDRERFVISHGVLRYLLGHYLSLAPEVVKFDTHERGKPYIKGDPIHFNMSHAGEWVLIGFSQADAVGVDVERQNNESDGLSIAKRFFHPKEYDFLASLSDELLNEGFFHLWACKEAVVKALGCGVADQLQKFIISGGVNCPINVHWEKNNEPEIFLTALSPAPEYRAALASLKRLHTKVFSGLKLE